MPLPRLIDLAMRNGRLAPYRQRVISPAEGRVLEIGARLCILATGAHWYCRLKLRAPKYPIIAPLLRFELEYYAATFFPAVVSRAVEVACRVADHTGKRGERVRRSDGKNRSGLLERAARAYLLQLERHSRDLRDIEIIDRVAGRLNREAMDTLVSLPKSALTHYAGSLKTAGLRELNSARRFPRIGRRAVCIGA